MADTPNVKVRSPHWNAHISPSQTRGVGRGTGRGGREEGQRGEPASPVCGARMIPILQVGKPRLREAVGFSKDSGLIRLQGI